MFRYEIKSNFYLKNGQICLIYKFQILKFIFEIKVYHTNFYLNTLLGAFHILT